MRVPPDSLPILLAVGWVVRAPFVGRDEGHEAITRAACEGLALDDWQQEALIRGVRAPDVSLAGLLVSALPFAQPRHALRAWSGTSSTDAVGRVRGFLTATHLRAIGLPEGQRRWRALGEVLHCLQDSFSPAHVDRVDGEIVRMKHWGPLDRLRRGADGDEHGFPSDPRDSAWRDDALTDEALAAAEASRAYLEIAVRSRPELDEFLDEYLGG